MVQFIPEWEDRGRGISEQEIFIILVVMHSVPRCSQVKLVGRGKNFH